MILGTGDLILALKSRYWKMTEKKSKKKKSSEEEKQEGLDPERFTK